MFWKLKNPIKNYDWGSYTSFNHLFNIPNKDHQPQAELWMGIHDEGCSVVTNEKAQEIKLSELIASSPSDTLGQSTYHQFHTLPFLFKVLAAEKTLSIQVHPNKIKAEQGFEKENQLAIPLNAHNRNFKDANHKPELIYALTPFKAMNAFRPITEILDNFTQYSCPILHDVQVKLLQNSTYDGLKFFITELFTLTEPQKNEAINQLMNEVNRRHDTLSCLIKTLAQQYPYDIGLFMPLILNVIELQPGEAMFLRAETPHAYIHGTGLEIMANSNNVLRAGLTPKYIDTVQLIDNTCFENIPLSQLKTVPRQGKTKTQFIVPVTDFKFEILHSQTIPASEIVTSAEILFCIQGQTTIVIQQEHVILNPGESLFIPAYAKNYTYYGKGQLARALS